MSPAASGLDTIGIRTVFDLAASRIFSAPPAALLAVPGEIRPSRRPRGSMCSAADAVDAPAGVPVTELVDQPIAILQGSRRRARGGPRGCTRRRRPSAIWRRGRLTLAAEADSRPGVLPGREAGFDPEAPADLLPRKSGVYPTERVFYRKLLLDAVPAPGEARRRWRWPRRSISRPRSATPGGFKRLATGALLSFSQSWFAQGLTLGQLLHSTSLAPGESTRIAMIDWSRRTQCGDERDHRRDRAAVQHEDPQPGDQRGDERDRAGVPERASTSTRRRRRPSRPAARFGFDLGPLAFGGRAALDHDHRGDEPLVVVRRRAILRPATRRTSTTAASRTRRGAQPPGVDRARGVSQRSTSRSARAS